MSVLATYFLPMRQRLNVGVARPKWPLRTTCTSEKNEHGYWSRLTMTFSSFFLWDTHFQDINQPRICRKELNFLSANQLPGIQYYCHHEMSRCIYWLFYQVMTRVLILPQEIYQVISALFTGMSKTLSKRWRHLLGCTSSNACFSWRLMLSQILWFFLLVCANSEVF